MRQAIFDAGLIPSLSSDNLYFVLEPEAAVTQVRRRAPVEAPRTHFAWYLLFTRPSFSKTFFLARK